MSRNVRVTLHPSFAVLADTTAARLITRLLDVQGERGEATVVLTGGSVGIATLKSVASSPARLAVDWAKVNIWFGDERFVPAGQAWAHLDVYSWNDSDRPGKPGGGEAQGLRAAFSMLQARFDN